MSTISAGTSGGTALVQTGDTTGALVIKTGGSATTAATFNADQTTTFAGAVTAPSFSGTSSTATNLAGGSNGTIPYQSASGTTQMLAVGTAGQLLQTNGAGAPTWATVSAGFTLGTPTTASGTPINFTGIPAGVKQVVVTFTDIYLTSADTIYIKLGVAGPTFPNAYVCMGVGFSSSAFSFTQYSGSGFNLPVEYASANMQGQYIFNLQDASTGTWVGSGVSVNAGTNNASSFSSGKQVLSGTLAAIQIRTRLGYSYSSGTINISYV